MSPERTARLESGPEPHEKRPAPQKLAHEKDVEQMFRLSANTDRVRCAQRDAIARIAASLRGETKLSPREMSGAELTLLHELRLHAEAAKRGNPGASVSIDVSGFGPEMLKAWNGLVNRMAMQQLRAQREEVSALPSQEERLRAIGEISNRVYQRRRMSLSEDLFMVSHGIDPDTSEQFFEQVSGEIGCHFDAHGIAKMQQLDHLLHLLTNGIDPAKPFFSAPFELPSDKKAALGSALGTGGGTPYKDGIAVVTGGYDQPIHVGGIKHVFVNDVYQELREPLAAAFPHIHVHLLSEQKPVMEQEALRATENKHV